MFINNCICYDFSFYSFFYVLVCLVGVNIGFVLCFVFVFLWFLVWGYVLKGLWCFFFLIGVGFLNNLFVEWVVCFVLGGDIGVNLGVWGVFVFLNWVFVGVCSIDCFLMFILGFFLMLVVVFLFILFFEVCGIFCIGKSSFGLMLDWLREFDILLVEVFEEFIFGVNLWKKCLLWLIVC